MPVKADGSPSRLAREDWLRVIRECAERHKESLRRLAEYEQLERLKGRR